MHNVPAITAKNLRSAAALYVAAMLDELKLFAVADHVAAQWASGILPIGRSKDTEALYRYHMAHDEHLDAPTRARMYARAFGRSVTATENLEPNDDFEPLWNRFFAAVAAHERQGSPARESPPPVGREEIRRAGRDLALYLNARSDGATLAASRKLARQVELALRALSSPALLKYYGTNGVWELVEKIASEKLGCRPDVTKFRSRAETGARFLSWLASATPQLESNAALPVLPSVGARRSWIDHVASAEDLAGAHDEGLCSAHGDSSSRDPDGDDSKQR